MIQVDLNEDLCLTKVVTTVTFKNIENNDFYSFSSHQTSA